MTLSDHKYHLAETNAGGEGREGVENGSLGTLVIVVVGIAAPSVLIDFGGAMRKYVLASIACCAVGVCTPGHASASPLDDSFLVALRDDGIVVPLSVDPIPAADAVCTDLKKGEPAKEIAVTEHAADFPNPAAFVDLAIEYFCPQYTSWGRGPLGAGG